jgi:tetratricopeptide (TPR) repeat protein
MRLHRFPALLLTALLVAATLSAGTAPAAGKSGLPWIDDDYARALTVARAKKVPIFVDLWAPWCHTCRSMKAFVFTDKALAPYAPRFVWLSIDTEKPQNAGFMKKFPIRAWPSFYVIDPQKETVALRWVGGATVAQLEKVFADGTKAAGGAGKSGGGELARADALYSAGDYAEAAKGYEKALAAMTPKSSGYARAVESRLFSLMTTRNRTECVAFARKSLPGLRNTSSAVSLSGGGLDCALGMPEDAPGRAAAIAEFEKDAAAVLADKSLSIIADDRSALYGSLVEAREEAKDLEGAHTLALAWVADLDAEAARTKTSDERTALDPDRLTAFQAAGEIAKAIPMLEASQKDFPQDYNPPARLALVYLELKQYAPALAASDQALALVYGPRKLRVLAVRTDIYKGMGQAAEARKTVEQALAYAEALPAGQRSDSAIDALKKQLAETVGSK